jgi:dienelactone hydrolase
MRSEPPPPLWGSLRAGPYEVGFRPVVAFDPARVYGKIPEGVGLRRAEDKAMRPVLIAVWYPAAATARAAPRLRYRDYIEWPLRGTPGEALAADFAAYERDEIALEMLSVERNRPRTPAESRELDGLLATEMAARRGAAQAAGAFPLVIYTPGAQSTPDDNFVMCEYLASQGYVVAAGSFLSNNGVDFGQRSDAENAALDDQLIIQTVTALGGVDSRRIALVGHSLGAQYSLVFAVAHPAIDAVVSLDTTWDYPASQKLFTNDPTLKQFKDGAPAAATPVLAFAKNGADYAPFAGMTHAARTFVTVDGMFHDAFTAQGALGASHRTPDPEYASAAVVRARYDAICRYVLAFFDATLLGRPEAEAFLSRPPAEAVPGVDGIHVERRTGVPLAPTLRDLLELAIAAGGAAAIERCAQRPASEPCPDGWATKVGEVLVQRRQFVPAIAILEADQRQRPTAVDSVVLLGDAQLARGDREAARRAYQEVLRRAPHKTLEDIASWSEATIAFTRQRAREALEALDDAPGR